MPRSFFERGFLLLFIGKLFHIIRALKNPVFKKTGLELKILILNPSGINF